MFAQAVVTLLALQLSAAVPNDAGKAAFARGERALGANQLDQAAAAYRQALVESPGYAAAHNGLGSVLFKQGQASEAIAQFQKATEVDASFALGWFNLGFASRKTGDYATAARAYERYTQLEPSDPDGFYGLGESQRLLGDGPRSIAAFERFVALEKRPKEQGWVQRAKEQLLALRAALPDAGAAPLSAGGRKDVAKRKVAEGDRLLADKRYREASFAYQEALEADEGHLEASFKLGSAYAILGSYPQAIERWTRVIQSSADAEVRRSAQENIAKAQAKMTQGGSAPPPAQGPGAPVAGAEPARLQARAKYEAGVRQVNARDYTGAVNSLSGALALDPGLAVAFVARGSANIGLQRYAEAARDYQRALELEPSMASPLYGLAESYRAMGRTADARGYYDRYAGSKAPDVRPELVRESKEKAQALR